MALLDNNYQNDETELVKLTSFAYDMYADRLAKFSVGTGMFPKFAIGADEYSSYDMVRIKEGTVWGRRFFPFHDDPELSTELGLTVGKIVNNKFVFDYAILFCIDNDKNYISTWLLKCVGTNADFRLEAVGSFSSLSENERKNYFIKSMTILGFRKPDVEKVMAGSMSARDAYINVAPDDIKYKQWVSVDGRIYTFQNNLAIDGSYANIRNFDSFPFPFTGDVIIDCSKVDTASIDLSNNFLRRVKLINVNKNPGSIMYANLRNAIIDETIDLSKVKAFGTIFGTQKIINIKKSLAKLNPNDLVLANICDSDYIQLSNVDNSIASATSLAAHDTSISILANVSTKKMLEEALANNMTGIGLLRTETLFYMRENMEKYLQLFIRENSEINKELLQEFKKEQGALLDTIFARISDLPVTIRLFDFRIDDILSISKRSLDDLEKDGYYLDVRGAEYLYFHNRLLKAQVEAIFQMANKYSRNVNILVPYITNIKHLNNIKTEIAKVNNTYGVDYKFGAMIENLEAVYNCDDIARLADFISFGLNDLTESVTSLSRKSGEDIFSYLNDDVKGYIKEAIIRAKVGNKDIEIGACGRHTDYEENLTFFESVGIKYISVSPDKIETLKNDVNTGEKVLIKNVY